MKSDKKIIESIEHRRYEFCNDVVKIDCDRQTAIELLIYLQKKREELLINEIKELEEAK